MLANEFYMFTKQVERARALGCTCKEDRGYSFGWGHSPAIMNGGTCSVFIRDDDCPVHSAITKEVSTDGYSTV